MFHHQLNQNKSSPTSVKWIYFRTAAFTHGFTLLELLIAIIIVGLLAAIALPSFLRQVARAKSSEARSIHGSILRAQQSYRVEHGTFANDLALLDVKVSDSPNYTYKISEASTTHAIHVTRRDGEPMIDYESGIVIQGGHFRTLICEGDQVGTRIDTIGATSVTYDSSTSSIHCNNGQAIE